MLYNITDVRTFCSKIIILSLTLITTFRSPVAVAVAVAVPWQWQFGVRLYGPPLGRRYHVTRQVTRCSQNGHMKDRALLSNLVAFVQ